uniref:Phosphatidylglycerophosphatase A n=1 Tax=Thermodesulfobacterium geofontis TaxID=1295609 RepID=A0A7C4NZC0_9BACT
MNLKRNYKILPFNQFDKNFFWVFISSGALIGFLPPCPGTFGSLEGLIIFWFLKNLSLIYQLFLILGIIIIGIISSDWVSKFLKDKDPDFVVIDEIAGMWISVLGKNTLMEFILAFIIFRIVDIKKPYPLKISETLPYGWGIVIDDIIAGILTNFFVILLLHIAKYLSLI